MVTRDTLQTEEMHGFDVIIYKLLDMGKLMFIPESIYRLFKYFVHREQKFEVGALFQTKCDSEI